MPPESPTTNTSLFARRVGVALLLAIGGILLYAPTFSYEFINYDDPVFVPDNPYVNRGITADGVRWAFGIHGPSQWHPLTWLSHMLDVQLFGPTAAGAHHATNALLHAINTVLVYVVLISLTGATWRSAAVAALFGWHPTRVESVAWVSERKDLLCALFTLATIWAYVRYVRRPGGGGYLLVLLSYALALMAKPMAVVLPVLLLLLDYWPIGRFPAARRRTLILEKIPLLLLAFVSTVLSYLCQVEAGAVASMAEASLAGRFANAIVSYVRYIRMAILPTNLSVFYPRQTWEAWQVGGAAIILLAITAAVATWRKAYAIVGWCWFVLSLGPVIGILQVGDQAIADRYTYLPLLGIFIAVIWAMGELVDRRHDLRRPLAYGIGAATLVYAIATAVQVTHWQNTTTIMSHAVGISRDNSFAQYVLGLEMSKNGRTADAAKHYAEAVRVKPSYLEAQVNLGAALEVLGDRIGAERHYRAALAIDPNDADAKANLEALLAGGAGSPKRRASNVVSTAPSQPPG